MKRTVIILAAVCLFASASMASAENRAETFSVSPFVGGYLFDGVEHRKTSPEVGLRAGYNFTDRIGAEGAIGLVNKPNSTKNAGPSLDVINYNLDLLYHMLPKNKLVPFLAVGYGARSVEYDNTTHTSGAFNYGVGVKYFLTENFAFRGDVRHLIFRDDVNSTIDKGTLHNVEYNVGLSFIFGGAKPAPAPVVAAPPPPPAAPSASLSASPASVTKGQNATLAWSSQNASDCSIQPDIGKVPTQGTRTVAPSVNTSYVLSCTGPGGSVSSDAALAVMEPPKPPPVDTDKDGVIDDLDQCPNTPAGVAVDKVGCPLDSDKDGVPDYLDKCPDTPAGYVVDKDGCPPPPEKLCIKLEVEFDTGKADVKKKYHDEIGKVAEFLKTYADSTGTIEGHTDNVGGADMNMKLSQRRADSIRQYLVDNYGIAAERLSAKGYGLTKPVADNKTAAGRQKNRRINATFDCVVIPKKK